MDVAERIDELLQSKGISGYKMCQDLGISRSFMTELRKGRSKGLTIETAGKLASYFEVPVKFFTEEPPFDQWDLIKSDRKAAQKEMWFSDELLLKKFGIENIDAITLAQYINFIDTVVVGVEPKANNGYDLKVKPWAEIQICDGEKEKPATKGDELNKPKLPSNVFPVPKMRRVPVLGTIRAGMPILAEENIEGYEYADVPADQGYFYLRVKGDSMINARICDGDLVLIKQQPCADDGQIVACLVNGDEATLKRYYRQKDMIILKPENPSYTPIVVPCKDFDSGYARILGIVTEVKFKV